VNSRNYIFAGIFAAAFIAAFLTVDGAVHFLNPVGLLIVISGTLGATFLSYPSEDLVAAFRVARNAYAVKVPTAEEVVNTLLGLSLKSRRDGMLSLETDEKKTEVSFLRDALGMLADGFQRKEIEDILVTETHFFRRRRERHERVFRHMARLAPAFGVTGSVVGLIGMLTGLGDTVLILKMIPVALTSTLYGIVLCNFVLNPIAENIHFKTQRELLMQRMVVEGVLAIIDERNSHRLERKLKALMTPSARASRDLNFVELRRRYLALTSENEPA